MAKTPLFKFEFHIAYSNNNYKGFLNKLKTLIEYSATVGIHAKEGKQKIYHRYTNSSGKSKISGISHRMTLIKLAYQNEFGADIRIRPRYKTVTQKSRVVYNSFKARTTETTSSKFSTLRGAKEQGYLLLSKTGKFVMYKKPNTVIHIPQRSFIRKTAEELDPKVQQTIGTILNNTLTSKGYTANQAINKIASIVQYKMKSNVKNNQKRNSPWTIKAKGYNSPLVDEQDRIFRGITYKVYKNIDIKGSTGQRDFRKQNLSTVDKLLKNSEQLINKGLISQNSEVTNVFVYKKSNPNFQF